MCVIQSLFSDKHSSCIALLLVVFLFCGIALVCNLSPKINLHNLTTCLCFSWTHPQHTIYETPNLVTEGFSWP